MLMPPEDICSLWQAKQFLDSTGLTKVSNVGGFGDWAAHKAEHRIAFSRVFIEEERIAY